MIIKIYNAAVNFLSFAGNSRKLRKKINISIDLPEVIAEFPDSHPRGFIKEFKKRRTTIVETYLRITKILDSASFDQRIRALKLLSEHITYSRSIKMPLNAARVQLAIMKEVVKNRDNKRIQLELMRDFTVTSFGHPRSIRKYLNKFNIIEVPETGEELRDLKMGWDFHVHDNTSYGLKSPIQLIIDAFIKGISELTIAYNNLDHEEAVKEVLEAGKILGIKVNIALEFSAMTNENRFHYMYILPNFASKKEKFKKFLKHQTEAFKEFLQELDENEKKRVKNIKSLIFNFNENYLPKINEGYSHDSIYYLHPISLSNAVKSAGYKIYSRRQLGEYLYPQLKKVYEKRALQITALMLKAKKSPSLFTLEELQNIKTRFKAIRSEYMDLDPEKIRIEYFLEDESIIAESAVSKIEEIFEQAKKSGGKIKLISPLEHGLQAAIDLIIANHKMIAVTEIYNMYDTIITKESEFVIFTEFIKLINEGKENNVIKFLKENKFVYNQKKLFKAIDYIRHSKLLPSVGSDAAGRSTLTPGMGFILKSRLHKYQRNFFAKNHHKLPGEISLLMFKMAKIPKSSLKAKDKPEILCLGKQISGQINMLGDENIQKPIHILNAWEYLNPGIKNFIFILIGFIPAYLILGPIYALLWFAITGSRNIFVDLVSGNGINPNEWHESDINWSNLAQSLLFTGFSVPILGFVKTKFDVVWSGAQDGTWYEIGKFFFINIANGTYLATHNYFRGFDKQTVRANFFRSILAWPLSVVFAPIGNALMIPSIVQAKFWSDFIASIIEGSAKYKAIIKIKDKIMHRLLPETICEDKETEKLAMLDMIFFIKESNRTKTSLQKLLRDKPGFIANIKNFFKRNKNKASIKPSWYELKERFDDPALFDQLIEFIIRNYNNEQSLYLIRLLSANFEKTRKWILGLGSNKK